MVSHSNLEGGIPLTYTNLTKLTRFIFVGTYLCEPSTPEFIAWKSTVATWESTGYYV